jgi:hypothetical protein
VSDWLIDKSALVRLADSPDATEWANRIERGLARITTVTRLEVGYSGPVRPGPSRGPAATATVCDAGGVPDPGHRGSCCEVLSLLADRGQHRAPSIPDLMVAATAELAGLTVLHVDKDFELIANITGQPLERLNLTGPVPEMDSDNAVDA